MCLIGLTTNPLLTPRLIGVDFEETAITRLYESHLPEMELGQGPVD